ncbi:hypothetical protein DFH27DRAFT_352282 [Peziza echinospora]|nr:hypothetical protein DFH27DRAFT_352282 [Peziza echinospora]
MWRKDVHNQPYIRSIKGEIPMSYQIRLNTLAQAGSRVGQVHNSCSGSHFWGRGKSRGHTWSASSVYAKLLHECTDRIFSMVSTPSGYKNAPSTFHHTKQENVFGPVAMKRATNFSQSWMTRSPDYASRPAVIVYVLLSSRIYPHSPPAYNVEHYRPWEFQLETIAMGVNIFKIPLHGNGMGINCMLTFINQPKKKQASRTGK